MRGSTLLRVVLVFVSISSFTPAHGAGCEEVDLRQDTCPNGQPRLPAVRDQGDTNYCWAYSLADFYSYSTCEVYSGLQIGLSTNLSFGEQQPVAAKHEERRRETAPQRHTRNVAGAAHGGKPTASAEDDGPPTPAENLNSGMAVQDGHRILKTLHGACLERDYSSRRKEIADSERYTAFLENVWARRQEANAFGCQVRPVPDATFNVERNVGQLRSTIHEGLNRRTPVFINYNGAIASERRANRAGTTHVSLIVGRRMNHGRCQLLLRDPTPITQSVWELSNGYAWIDESALVNATREVTTAQTYTAPTSTLAGGTTERTPASSSSSAGSAN